MIVQFAPVEMKDSYGTLVKYVILQSALKEHVGAQLPLNLFCPASTAPFEIYQHLMNARFIAQFGPFWR